MRAGYRRYYHRVTDHWYYEPPSHIPTMMVSDESEDQRKAREEKAKHARVVPFGFSRVIAPEPVERDPILWEGED